MNLTNSTETTNKTKSTDYINSTLSDASNQNIIEHKDETSKISQSILIILILLVLNEIMIQALINLRRKYKDAIFLKYIDNTQITTTIGLLAGIVLNITNQGMLLEDLKGGFSQIFLIILLPPIIFDSALKLQIKEFFHNIGSIMMYAIPGTLIAMFVTSAVMYSAGYIGLANSLPFDVTLVFGAVISATDPVTVLSLFKSLKVNQKLHALIFGESVLNDAVAIICYNSMIKLYIDQSLSVVDGITDFIWVFIGSMFIGFIVGIISALILKYKTDELDPESPLIFDQARIQTTIILLVPWVTYLIAEGLNMSGIVSIIFCGISMARYAVPNLDSQSIRLTYTFYHSIAYNFENSIFLFIGIGIMGFDLAWASTGAGLILTALVAITLGRICNLLLMTRICNYYRNVNFINEDWTKIMFFSGMRGAMAYALSLEITEIFKENHYGDIILNLTLMIVIVNIYLQGPYLYHIIKKTEQQNDDVHEVKAINDSFFNKLKSWVALFDEKVLMIYLIKKPSINSQQLELGVSLEKDLYKQQTENDLRVQSIKDDFKIYQDE